MKNLTGGDTRKGASLHGKQYYYEPTDKLWLLTNYLPAIRDASDGMWDRVRVFPFNKRFEENEQDHELRRTLMAEAEGIFAWIVEGAYRYLEAGRLPPLPQTMVDARTQYRNDNDTLRRFIADRMERGQDKTVGVRVAHEAYKSWSFEQGDDMPIAERFFRKYLAERNVLAKDTNSGAVFQGWALRNETGQKAADFL
jgi:putative DNA primase/helicase